MMLYVGLDDVHAISDNRRARQLVYHGIQPQKPIPESEPASA